MSISVQRHTLDTLSDATGPGECPMEPVSTWAFEQVGYLEPIGEYAELVEHNRDLAKGLLDPGAGFLTGTELDDERTDEDALHIARIGGERVYAQEQGFAPLHLFPGLRRDGSANADAIMAAWLESQHPATSLTTPDLPERRHWGDVDLGEQLEGVNPLDAEQRPVVDPDALVWDNSRILEDGGVFPSFGLNSVDFAEMHENAPDLAEHIERMLDHQDEQLLREWRHAREHERLHSLVQADHGVRRTLRGDPRYGPVTAPWREQNQARRAALAARAELRRVEFDLRANVRRTVEPVVAQPRPAELLRGTPAEVLAYVERWLDYQPPLPQPKPPAPATPAPRRRPALELPHIDDARWWGQHGHRILRQVAEWHPSLEPGTDAWWDAAEDAYYVLKAGV